MVYIKILFTGQTQISSPEHHNTDITVPCEKDVDFQLSQSTIGARFEIDQSVFSHIREIQIEIQEQEAAYVHYLDITLTFAYIICYITYNAYL